LTRPRWRGLPPAGRGWTWNRKRTSKHCVGKSASPCKDWGRKTPKKLYTRLLELAAADNVAELIAGDPHECGGDRKGIYSLDLARGGRLLFRPAHRESPTTPAGNIDWKRVSRVVIIHIGGHLKRPTHSIPTTGFRRPATPSPMCCKRAVGAHRRSPTTPASRTHTPSGSSSAMRRLTSRRRPCSPGFSAPRADSGSTARRITVRDFGSCRMPRNRNKNLALRSRVERREFIGARRSRIRLPQTLCASARPLTKPRHAHTQIVMT